MGSRIKEEMAEVRLCYPYGITRSHPIKQSAGLAMGFCTSRRNCHSWNRK